MTACIGDFGLALQFRPGEVVGDTHGQVCQDQHFNLKLKSHIALCHLSFLPVFWNSLVNSVQGGDAKVHGPWGAGGGHQLLQGRLPQVNIQNFKCFSISNFEIAPFQIISKLKLKSSNKICRFSGSTCTPVVLFTGRWPVAATWLKLLRLSHTGWWSCLYIVVWKWVWIWHWN